jgi:glycine/D-amino acid oxidase-like deaminating enzyme
VARKVWDLTRHNRDIARGLSREFGTPWDARGSLLLALDDTEAEDLERAAAAMREDGIPAPYTHKDPTRRGFVAVIPQADDAGIHPVKFAQALAASSGATIYEQSEVFAIEELPGGGYELKSRRATVRCGKVALCTNAYAPLLHPYFAEKVIPTRGQILCTEPLGVPLLQHLCYADYGYEYFRQLPDGRLLVGGWRHHFRDTEVGYEDRTTPGVQQGLEGFIARYFPEAQKARITHRWSGTMGFSADGIPLVGSLPDMRGVYFAVGFTGHGIGIGLATAERLAAHMLMGQDLEWLDIRRFDAAQAAPVEETLSMPEEG